MTVEMMMWGAFGYAAFLGLLFAKPIARRVRSRAAT